MPTRRLGVPAGPHGRKVDKHGRAHKPRNMGQATQPHDNRLMRAVELTVAFRAQLEKELAGRTMWPVVDMINEGRR